MNILIYEKKNIMGTLRQDNVIIVPNLNRRLFLVNSFLNKGNSWVQFDKNNLWLGLQNGPTIIIQITSLHSNALAVEIVENPKGIRKTQISTDSIHSRFHRSNRPMSTIKAHGLQTDNDAVQEIDYIYTSYQVMTTIPCKFRENERMYILLNLLDEIQINTAPNPEPVGVFGRYFKKIQTQA